MSVGVRVAVEVGVRVEVGVKEAVGEGVSVFVGVEVAHKSGILNRENRQGVINTRITDMNKAIIPFVKTDMDR